MGTGSYCVSRSWLLRSRAARATDALIGGSSTSGRVLICEIRYFEVGAA